MNRLAIISTFIGSIVIFSIGYRYGTNKVQSKFDDYKYQQSQTMLEKQYEYAKLDAEHKDAEAKYIHKLQELKDTYEEDIDSINSTYSDRLLKSEERANLYRRKAEQGSYGFDDLADRTAKLDKSLEEGRVLVKELSRTLRLREEQLNTLGKVIENDRNKLINERGN